MGVPLYPIEFQLVASSVTILYSNPLIIVFTDIGFVRLATNFSPMIFAAAPNEVKSVVPTNVMVYVPPLTNAPALVTPVGSGRAATSQLK